MKRSPDRIQNDTFTELAIGRREAARRIYRAMDFLFEHIADRLTIPQLAAQANFSLYHFVRLFAEITGETPAEHLRRVRLERAANFLYAWPHHSILDIAIANGFHSAAVFSRAFRSHFGMSPRAWRRADFWRSCGLFTCWRPLPCTECEPYSELFGPLARSGSLTVRPWPARRPVGLDKIDLVTMPPQRIAYTRTIGPLESAAPHFFRLTRWAAARGLTGPDSAFFGQLLADPHITASRHFISDTGIVVAEDFTADRYVNVRTVPGGKYLRASFTGTASDTIAAIRYLWFSAVPDHACMSAGRPHHHHLTLADNPDLLKLPPGSVVRWTFYLPVIKKEIETSAAGTLPITKSRE